MARQSQLDDAPQLETVQADLYELLLESIPSSVVLVDRSLRVLSVNRNFLSKLGRDRRSTIGASMSEVYPPEILERMELEEQVHLAFRTNATMREGRFGYRAPGVAGSIYYYKIVPVKADSAVACVMILMEDVTERERLVTETALIRGHLASVVEHANDIVVSIDLRGSIVSWNPAAAKITGISTEEAKGRTIYDLCADEDRKVMRELVARVVRGERVECSEIGLMGSTQEVAPAEWTFSLMRDPQGHASHLVGVGRNLTEVRSLKAKLFRSEKLAALGRIVGGIAHELRNPLSVSFSAAQFLKENDSDPVFRAECVQRVYEGVERASRIIDNLLRFSSPGETSFSDDVNVADVTRSALDYLILHGSFDGITVTQTYPSIPALVRGHGGLIEQVVTNLVLNAREAISGAGRIDACVGLEKGWVTLTVHDSGCGIPDAVRAQVFEPFFTTRTAGKGIGLGLTLCQFIVAQHKGSIEVQTSVGNGSCFMVRLPAAV